MKGELLLTHLEKFKEILNLMDVKFIESECHMHMSNKNHHHFEVVECIKIEILNEERLTKNEKIPFTFIKRKGNYGLYIYFYKETGDVLQIIS